MARTGCTRVTLEGLVFRQLLFEALDLGVEVLGCRKGGGGGGVQGRDNPGLRSPPGQVVQGGDAGAAVGIMESALGGLVVWRLLLLLLLLLLPEVNLLMMLPLLPLMLLLVRSTEGGRL